MQGFNAVRCGVVLAVGGALLFGCGGKTSLKQNLGDASGAKDVYPAAIERLVDGKYANSIRAVGMGTHPDQIIALQKAGLDADQKVAQQFEMELSALQKRFLESINDQRLEEYRNTVQNFVNIRIQGITIAKEMVAEGSDGYQAYVLKVLSADVLKGLIDEQTNALTGFKAMQAYKELEERVIQDNAAREKRE